MIKKVASLMDKFSSLHRKQKMIFSATVFWIIVNMIILILSIKLFMMFFEKFR